jgi:hypothetical protein
LRLKMDAAEDLREAAEEKLKGACTRTERLQKQAASSQRRKCHKWGGGYREALVTTVFASLVSIHLEKQGCSPLLLDTFSLIVFCHLY